MNMVKNSSGIITVDKSGNILIGNVVVNNLEMLDELIYGLLQERRIYTIETSKNLGGLSSSINSGFFREGDNLVQHKITDTEDGVSIYTKKVINCTILNSLRLLISLSGKLDAANCDKLTKRFIGMGIINCGRFEDIWETCSANIVNGVFSEISRCDDTDLNELLTNDLILFREALKQGVISYDVNDEINFSKVVDYPVFKAWDNSIMQRIGINNALLHEDNTPFEKYKSRIRNI